MHLIDFAKRRKQSVKSERTEGSEGHVKDKFRKYYFPIYKCLFFNCAM